MSYEYQEQEFSGWWTGRAYIDLQEGSTPFDETVYEDFFDTDWIDDNDKQMIFSIADDLVNGVPNGDYVIPCDRLNEYAKEQIKEQIMKGQMEGTIWIDGNDLQWAWRPECTLNGEEIDFQDLSDVSKEHIINEMLDGCHQGEVYELVTTGDPLDRLLDEDLDEEPEEPKKRGKKNRNMER